MPTYVCWSRAGQLSPEQRQRIATAITTVHHEAAKAPRYFVQVIFNDIVPDAHFISGKPAPDTQIWIRADIRAGRTQEQKDALLTRIAADVSEISGAPISDIWVYICDIPGSNILEFGHILPPPGEEDAWFDKLPPALQQRLRALT
jgi:phenylpyruvate tautomerase PptA (4-oxalocrotonate tautomerase family)